MRYSFMPDLLCLGRGGGVIGICGTKFLIDLIDIINQFHDGIMLKIVCQPATEFGGEVKFAVGKSSRSTETAHNGAGNAVNALLGFFVNDRAGSRLNGLALFQHNNI